MTAAHLTLYHIVANTVGAKGLDITEKFTQAVRCDGCKDWESLGGGICFSHTSPMNGTDMVVRPYDCCSHWSPKS